MTDDLMTDLRAVGDLLDQRSEGALADADSDGARILPLAPAVPSRGRRGQALLASAAAVVLVTALVATASWNRGDSQIGVASGGQIAALVPSAGIGEWAQLDVHTEEIVAGARGGEAAEGTIFVAPAGSSGPDRMARSMRVMVLRDTGTEDSTTGTEEVSGSGLDGYATRDTAMDRLMVITTAIESEGTDYVIHLTASSASTVEEMLAVAALVDLATPIEEQTLDGWDTLGRVNRSTTASTVRSFYAETSGADGRWLHAASMTGVSDDAIWGFTEPYIAEATEVRGKAAWLLVEGSVVGLAWVEAPGVVMQISYGATSDAVDTSDGELVAEALAAAEDLVPVDAQGWDEFAAQETTVPDADDGWTTTTVEGSEGSGGGVPTFDLEELGAEHAMSGGLEDTGGWYLIWTRRDTGEMCWELSIDDGMVTCELPGDRDEYVGIATDAEGRAILAFGWLPDPGTFAEITAEGPDGALSSLGAGSAGEAIWAAPIPTGDRPIEVAFVTTEGDVISTIDLRARIEDREAGG